MFRTVFFKHVHKNQQTTPNASSAPSDTTQNSAPNDNSSKINTKYNELARVVSSNIDPKPWELYESAENEFHNYVLNR